MAGDDDIEWRVTPGLTDYAEAVAWMETRAAAIADGRAREVIRLTRQLRTISSG